MLTNVNCYSYIIRFLYLLFQQASSIETLHDVSNDQSSLPVSSTSGLAVAVTVFLSRWFLDESSTRISAKAVTAAVQALVEVPLG